MTIPRLQTSHVVLALIALLGAAAFYRYDYRPSQIRAECEADATRAAMATMRDRARLNPLLYSPEEAAKGFYLVADKEGAYKSCLRSHGIDFEPERESR
jgi:hypothetical protein